jgi:hypothetical protein
MKTIYLKSSTKEGLISDIAKVIEGYNGETEFSNGIIHGHYIGQINNSENESVIEGYHANLFVPDSLDISIFATLVTPPKSPVHQFYTI